MDDLVERTTENDEAKSLIVNVTRETSNRLHIAIRDNEKQRWEVPLAMTEDDILHSYQDINISNIRFDLIQHRYSMTLSESGKPGGNTILFSTKGCYFRYMDKYISLELVLPSQRLFGLGERMSNFSLREGTYVLFSKDRIAEPETRSIPGHHLHGMHPFLLYQLSNSLFAGLFVKTSNALQVKIQMLDNGMSCVRFTTIGGIIDLTVFYQGTAQFILQQYHKTIGKPPLPPLWALGYNHGQMGYNNVGEIKTIVHNFMKHNIPLDAVWMGADVFEEGTNFVINANKFVNLKQFIDELHTKNIKVVVAIKGGININQLNPAFVQAEARSCLVKVDKEKRWHIGRDFSGDIVYPDFFHPEMCNIWDQGIANITTDSGVDGIWLVLNEFSNMCDGDCHKLEKPLWMDNLPFTPDGLPLNSSTLSMSAKYNSPNEKLNNFLYEINVHPLNSLLEGNCTYTSLLKIRKGRRPLIISESTFPGTQSFAVGHLLSGTSSSWAHLKYSIPEMLSFQMFGVPLVGSSICGYYNSTDEDLCEKWFRLGLFYPLSLNFNHNKASPQEPYEFSARTLLIAKDAIRMKYSLLMYIYSTIFEMSLYGGAAARPLFFEFPTDKMAYRTSDQVFMYGKGLLIATSLQQDDQYSVYFPNADWYRVQTGVQIVWHNPQAHQGTFVQLLSAADTQNIYLRGGTIIPYQNAIGAKILNVEELRSLPMKIIVALDQNNTSEGFLIVDDGISSNTISQKQYRHYHFSFQKNVFKIMLLEGYNFLSPEAYSFEYLSSIEIWGATALTNMTSACALTYKMEHIPLNISYDQTFNILYVTYKGKDKIMLKSLEAISFTEDDDYDLCSSHYYSYKAKLSPNLKSMTAILEYNKNEFKLRYKMTALLITQYTLNWNVQPLNWTGWEVPGIIEDDARYKTTSPLLLADYFFGISSYPEPFYLEVANPNNVDEVFITTQNYPLHIREHFTQVTFQILATQLYGIGERLASTFALENGKYTIYSYDNNETSGDTKIPGNNMHGSHSFLMFRIPSNTFGALFMLNSNAMDIYVRKISKSSYTVTYTLSGGIIDLFIIQRGSPNLVLEQYHNLIGKPILPPYWAFGNHQSRRGYSSQEKLQEVVDKYGRAELPLDGLWIDIDYMNENVPFTIDRNRYPHMKEFAEEMLQKGIQLIPVILPFIQINATSQPYLNGLEGDVFIKSSDRQNPNYAVGLYRCGKSHFVDFLHPNSTMYWGSLLREFWGQIFQYSGIWLDMNEITNFCDGNCEASFDESRRGIPQSQILQDLIYIPGHRNLEKNSIPITSRYFTLNASLQYLYSEFNVHSMNSFLQARASSEHYILGNGRGFVFSRSTFPGSGSYAAHSFANSQSSWEYLRYSIIGISYFHMFGIPLTGFDICGYYGNASEELCRRWYQLAAFYPLSRNHNDLHAVDQEPFNSTNLKNTALFSLKLRYSLIRYIYTLHFQLAINGGSYFYPLFFEFPNDEAAYN